MPEASETYTTRQKMVALGVALLLLGSVIGAVLAFGSSGDGGSGELQAADGVLVAVQPDRLRLRLSEPLDGKSEIDFVVRPDDQAALDIAHLQIHSADGLPTRVLYERDGDTYVARSAQDLPTLR